MKYIEKNVIVFVIAFALSACGGGSSSDSDDNDSNTDGTTTAAAGESDAGSADAGSDAGESDTASAGADSGDAGADEGSTDSGTDPTITGGSNGDLGLYGFVDVDATSPASIDAGFFAFNSFLTPTLFEANFRESLDTCTITDTTDIDLDFENLPSAPEGFSVDSVSAGDVITVASGAGSYVELQRMTQFGSTFYDLPEGLDIPLPVPTDLNVSIPGDVYPTFTSIPVPSAVPLLVSSPGLAEPIGVDTVFTWTPSGVVDSYVEISASIFNLSTAAAFSFSTLDCTVADDGSFEFSAATKAEMGADFSASATVYRNAQTFHRNGSAILIVSSRVERSQ